MKKVIFCALSLLFSMALYSQKDSRIASSSIPLRQVDQYKLPPLDNEKLLAEEKERYLPGTAPRFAESVEVSINPRTHGTWETLENGKKVWRLRVHSKGAKSLNLGFTDYEMPQGGTLIMYTPDMKKVMGPFTPADNEEHGQLWTPILEGDELVVEIVLPAGMENELGLELQYINHDFLGFMSVLSGACNLDAICGAANGWPLADYFRDDMQSVGVYSKGGDRICTGFLISNTRNDCTPYFMTAHHCGVTAVNASSVVSYWNYQNSSCRTPGSVASGNPGNGVLTTFNTGAIFRASWQSTDFTLLEFDDPLTLDANAYMAGWTRSQVYNDEQHACIHHPDAAEKRITLADLQPYAGNWGTGNTPVPGGNHVIIYDWDTGSTEEGSSGAPLFNNDHHVIGQLHGGAATCNNDSYDSFGAFWASWNGGGTSSTRLKDWLDPDNLNPLSHDGYYEFCSNPCYGITFEEPETTLEINGTLVLTANQLIEDNIIVKTGGELRIISATIEMLPDANIIVERGARLLVDGGEIKLYGHECVEEGSYWDGISVIGNGQLEQPSDPLGAFASNEAGVVVLRDATIRNARHAISTTNPSCFYCWDYYGGLVDAEDSYFIDCYRAVEFMKYNEVNKSKFINCTFTDNGQNNLGGVSIWDTDGIVFDHCTFDNMGYGILVYDAGCTVKNECVFSNNDKGIAVRATSPVPSGSPVVIAPEGGGRNTFGPNNDVDIEINSGDLYKSVEIVENDFLGYNAYSPIWLDGRSTVRIRENDFGKADFTVFVENTDIGFVDIFCNNFHSNSFIPTYFRGRNDRTTIRANNFNDNYAGNITIDGDAGSSSIAPSQGWFYDPTKNCFSTVSDEHIWTFGNTIEFDYFIPFAPSNCEEPAQANYGTNNFEVYFALENLINCPYLEEEEVHDYQDYLSKRNEYLNILSLYQNNPNNAALIAQLLEVERSKELVISNLTGKALKNHATSIMEQVAALENNDKTWRILYGLYLQLDNFEDALATLGNLSDTEENDHFNLIQEINLERLQTTSSAYELAENQKLLLEEIAYSTSAERGHARALLSFLDIETFWPEQNPVILQYNGNLPSIEQSPLSPVTLKAFPNPADHSIQAELPYYVEQALNVEWYNLSGMKMASFSFDEGQYLDMDVSTLSEGLYFMKVNTSSDVIGVIKVIIQ